MLKKHSLIKLSVMFLIYLVTTIIYRYIKYKEFNLFDSLLFSVALLIGAIIVEISMLTFKKAQKK
jgi:phosphate starvation-inducible membrane PsiE